MRYLDIITEAAVPMTDYGYWVSPLGEITPVERHDHHDIIHKLCGLKPDAAMRAGWARTIAQPGALYMEVECTSDVTRAALSSLQRIARTEDFDSFMLDFHTRDGLSGRRFQNLNSMLEFIRQQSSMLAESINHSPLESAILDASKSLSWAFPAFATDSRALDDLYDAMKGSKQRPKKKLDLRHAVSAMVSAKRYLPGAAVHE